MACPCGEIDITWQNIVVADRQWASLLSHACTVCRRASRLVVIIWSGLFPPVWIWCRSRLKPSCCPQGLPLFINRRTILSWRRQLVTFAISDLHRANAELATFWWLRIQLWILAEHSWRRDEDQQHGICWWSAGCHIRCKMAHPASTQDRKLYTMGWDECELQKVRCDWYVVSRCQNSISSKSPRGRCSQAAAAQAQLCQREYSVPFLHPDNKPYTYLGVDITPTMNWAFQVDKIMWHKRQWTKNWRQHAQ